MLPTALVALILASSQSEGPDATSSALRRLSEEAEVFEHVAPEVLSEEVCRQKAARVHRRLRLGGAPGQAQPPSLSYQVREITSEYGFATLKEATDGLHEFRRVISVDGRPIESVAEARRKLTGALKDANDRERRRLLGEFERWGLEGAATDFGQCILLFTRRRLQDYEFKVEQSERIGPDKALVLSFLQRGGSQAFTIFDRNEVAHQPLEGRVWLRETDSLPLRIELKTARSREKRPVRDVAVIDYVMSAHGALMPASVLHRQYFGQELMVENAFQYGPFRKFSASAEIKFTEIDEPPAKPRPE
jgi:hypothetical protein